MTISYRMYLIEFTPLASYPSTLSQWQRFGHSDSSKNPDHSCIYSIGVNCTLDLWDKCRDPLRAGAENEQATKSMFQITDRTENNYHPSYVHQLRTDVFILILCLVILMLEKHLSTACSNIYRGGGTMI